MLCLSAVRLRGSSFHKIYPSVLRHQAVMSLYIHRSYSFVLICGRFRKHQGPPSLATCMEWKTVTIILFGALYMYGRLSSQASHTLHWHSEYPTDVYIATTNDKRRSYPDPLISESMVSFADSPFKFLLLLPSRFLDPLVLVFSIVKLLHPVRPK